MSTIAFSLDWLKCTFVYIDDITSYSPPMPEDNDLLEVPAIGSYNQALGNEYFSLSWHSERPEQKIMLQMTGKQLSAYRTDGGEEKWLLAFCNRNSGTYTRLDFAVDLFDCGGAPKDLYNLWRTPGLIAKSRTASIIEGQSDEGYTGTTVYIGSRSSERMMRVYEKGKQLGTKLDWLRVEIEYKGKRANQLAGTMLQYGVAYGGKSHIRRFVELTECEWFESIFDGDYNEVNIDAIGRPQTNREKWLFDVVIPALRGALKLDVPGIYNALVALLQEADNSQHHGPNLNPKNRN